jgi:hypothetical protein
MNFGNLDLAQGDSNSEVIRAYQTKFPCIPGKHPAQHHDQFPSPGHIYIVDIASF